MLGEAEKTTKAAINATVSAERQVDASREAMIADQRAWIEISEIRPISGIEKTDDGFLITIMVVVKNIGKTPARLSTIRIVAEPVLAPVNSNTDDIEKWKIINPDDEYVKGIVFPKRQTIRKQQFRFSRKKISALLQREKGNFDGFRYISVASCVFYRSIFSEQIHRTIEQIHIYHQLENVELQGRTLNLSSDGVALADLSQFSGVGFATSYAD